MRVLLPFLALLLVPRLAFAGDEPALPRSHGGSAYLSVGGFDRPSPYGAARDKGGFVVLGIPLDRVNRAAARATPPPLDPAQPSLERVVAMQPETFDLGAPGKLARACVSAAWRAAGLGDDDERLDGILVRARWSALLPEARLRAIRYDNARFYEASSDATSTPYDYAGANTGYEARLTWRLDRLVYADDEPAFERIRLEHLDVRHRIGQKVLDALFHWQRALLDLRTLPPTQQGTRDEADVVLRAVEAEAALDVLTNGWFGVHKPRTKAAAGPAKALGDL